MRLSNIHPKTYIELLLNKESRLLTIVHLDNQIDSAKPQDEISTSIKESQDVLHIFIQEGKFSGIEVFEISDNCLLIKTGPALGLKGYLANLAIRITQSGFMWFWDVNSSFQKEEIAAVVSQIRSSDGIDAFFIKPSVNNSLSASSQINEFHNGRFPSADQIILNRQLFERFGLFNIHLALRDYFLLNWLLRSIRFLRVKNIYLDSAKSLEINPDRANRIISLSQVFHSSTKNAEEQELDELEIISLNLGKKAAWEIYLGSLMPYYTQYRHVLPPGLLIRPQSVPFSQSKVLFIKYQYETAFELIAWNYQLQFEGARNYQLLYSQSELFSRGNITGHLISEKTGADIVVFTRTADDFNAHLAQECIANGHPTAYLLDDDLLTFHLYKGDFSHFAPGNPHYDAMVRTIESVDLVIGFTRQIRSSVLSHNPRYFQSVGSVPDEMLPVDASKPEDQALVHFAYAGGGYRTQEFTILKPAIQRIQADYGNRVKFSFWGMDSRAVGITGNVEYVPFSENYREYLQRLATAGFDVMLAPLTLDPPPKRGKSPNKFWEAAVANALGLYSDVPSYSIVEHLVTGIKVAEDTEAWFQAMQSVIEMPKGERERIRSNALEYVRSFFSTSRTAPVLEASFEATRLHHRLRNRRALGGKPKIAFFFPIINRTGGGEVGFWRKLETARKLGLDVMVVISRTWENTPEAKNLAAYLDAEGIPYEIATYYAYFTTPYNLHCQPHESELTDLRQFFAISGKDISIVYSLALVPAVGQVCSELGIPHVSVLHGVDDTFTFLDGDFPFKYCDLVQSDSIRYARKWSELLKAEWMCVRDTAPDEFFELGFKKVFVDQETPHSILKIGIVGTLMERKRQLELIQALDLLPSDTKNRVELHIIGNTDAYPDYGKECRTAIQKAVRNGCKIFLKGFASSLIDVYREMNVIMSISSFESFPTAIKEATSAGCLLIASRAGGIAELMVDGVNSILVNEVTPDHLAKAIQDLIQLNPDEKRQMRRAAYNLACEEFHPNRALLDVAAQMNLCLDIVQGNQENKLPAISTLPLERTLEPVKKKMTYLSEGPTQLPRRATDIGGGLTYNLVPAHDRWFKIDVMLGTHQTDPEGEIKLEIYSRVENLIRSVQIPLEKIHDNDWVSFQFKPIANSKSGMFLLKFQLVNSPPKTRISLYENLERESAPVRAVRKYARYVSLKLPSADLHCRLYYEPS